MILGALVLAAVRAYRWLGRDAFVSARSVVASQAGSKGRRPSDGVGTENAELEFDGTKLARRAAEALFPGLGRDAKETAERMEKTAREKVASSRAVRDVFGRVEVLVGPVERESVEEEGRLRVGFQVVGSRRAGMVWVEATAASVEEVEALWKLGRLSQVLMEVESVPGQLMAVDDEEEIGPGEDEQAGVREIEVKAERVEGAKEEPR